MKTPEEMAMEYIKDVETARNPSITAMAFPQMQRCFLAGYKAAKDQVIKEVEFYRQQEKIIFLLKNYAATIHTNSVRDALKDFIGQLESIVGKTVANHIPQSEKMDQTTNVNGMRFCIYCNDFHGGACAELRGKNHPALNQTNLPTSAKWISVKDRLPKKNILILCCSLKSLSPTYGWFDGAFWNVNDEPNYFKDKIDCISFITHWMPLPAPPKEEK